MSIKLLSGSGVNVPKVHIEIGLVATFGEKSTTSVLSDLFQVKVRKEKPHQASLAVPHKGYWFFIDETDVSSKRTIGVLNPLFRLKIKASSSQNIPVLNLPVGQ